MQQANAQELMKWQLEVLQRKEAIKEGNLQIARLRTEVDDVEAEIKESECSCLVFKGFTYLA